MPKLDIEELKAYLEYCDGDLAWKVGRGGVKAGATAGRIDSHGYIQVQFKGRKYLAHRLIFLMHHGYLPDYVDHINGEKANNRIENLRECTLSQNRANSKTPQNNSSGFKGVVWHKDAGKWQAQVRTSGHYKYLGLYDDIEEAALVAQKGRERYHGEFAR